MTRLGKWEKMILRRVIRNGGQAPISQVKKFIMGHPSTNRTTMDPATFTRVRKGNEQITQSARSLERKNYLYLRRKPGLATHKPIQDLFLTEHAIREGESWGLNVEDGQPILEYPAGNPKTITTYGRSLMVDTVYDISTEEEE